MDSLANGGRCDRECLRTSPADTQSAGDRFYSRFRTLLADAIVNPSIPSAAAILLTGAALVSQGRQSAGWTLCGTAYRMVIDMGCHLSTDTSHSHLRTGGVSEIEVDIEREWRRRLYWGALVTDATQSMYLGRQVTLRPSQGRVSQMLLDHYEELEEWSPLIDEAQSPGSNALLLAYRPRPAYAVSTFNALVKLAMISTRITQTFYSIDCVKSSPDTLWQTKADIEGDLSDWLSELPTHLRLDFDKHVPPPHQITPHTTYHVLNILLRRPFLEGGYLQDSTIADAGPSNDQSCTDSALAIWKLVSAYRDTFTLRRSPFLLSYAVYSAVVVILRQSKNAPPDHFQDAIGFFLTALSELQRGCNFGLRRPVAIIRDMMAELGSTQPPQYQPENQSAFSSILEMCSFDPNSQYAPNNAASGMEGCTFAQFEPLPHDFFNVLDDQEQNIVNDPLYGLFAQEPGGYNFQAG
ncbi:hypothetical protein B0A48_13217 [Cryoendolithus antarcticus]|uniref:Xylanolytic transcriptional activator regulatory domain-containing protein n=1 Tax=Cryoendolithus antarcticus TaxID=1507870 RepID=A0A1V8SNI2_9PEZI|nr:hypothetical protein B0A48_13217 [Cryoendolithus antarcticus]